MCVCNACILGISNNVKKSVCGNRSTFIIYVESESEEGGLGCRGRSRINRAYNRCSPSFTSLNVYYASYVLYGDLYADTTYDHSILCTLHPHRSAPSITWSTILFHITLISCSLIVLHSNILLIIII